MKIEIDKSKCNGCGICINFCPVSAISIKDGVAKINQTLCRRCKLCTRVCKSNAIKISL